MAEPDGYTLLPALAARWSSTRMCLSRHLLTPRAILILVAHPGIAAANLKDVIAVLIAQRSKSLPDGPTFIESGIAGLNDVEINAWVGTLAPCPILLASFLPAFCQLRQHCFH